MPIRIVLGVATALGALWLFSRKKKIFISYYYDKDRHYKRLLKAWSANDKFELEFEDVSTDVSIKSDHEEYIRRRISKQIKECDVFLVCVGQESHARKWISWEINKAKEHKKKIVAVKPNRNYTSPRELLLADAKWVFSFNEEKIRAAIES